MGSVKSTKTRKDISSKITKSTPEYPVYKELTDLKIKNIPFIFRVGKYDFTVTKSKNGPYGSPFYEVEYNGNLRKILTSKYNKTNKSIYCTYNDEYHNGSWSSVKSFLTKRYKDGFTTVQIKNTCIKCGKDDFVKQYIPKED